MEDVAKRKGKLVEHMLRHNSFLTNISEEIFQENQRKV